MTNQYKKSTLVILAAVLGGCSLMPNYERPATPVPAIWPDSVKLEVTTKLELTNWQHYFPDPRLQALIACLLYTSPSPRDRQKSRMPSSA